jgi:cobalt-zinc-cadmium efflux system membrane fusion protein
MSFLRAVAVVTATLCVLGACSRGEQKPPIAQPRVEKDTVVFDPASPQLAALHMEPAQPRGETVQRFNGRLVWDEDRTVRMFSPFGGRVLSIAVRAGDRVSAGQPLAVLASPELGMAQSEARKAEQDHALAQKSLARIEELHGAGVSPAKDLQVAQAELARTAAERARTQARLKLYGNPGGVDQQLSLRSPISGVVVERNLNPGQELRPDAQGDKALFVVSDPSHLWFILDVSEKDVALVKPGLEVRLASSALEGDPVTGRIAQVADLVDPQARTVKARGTVDNSERRLKAEMFVTAKLKVPAQSGMLVPTRAVYLRGEQYFLFVEAGPGRFTRKPIRIGPTSNGHQVVLSGLQGGEKVVVDGNLLLEKILASKD